MNLLAIKIKNCNYFILNQKVEKCTLYSLTGYKIIPALQIYWLTGHLYNNGILIAACPHQVW